ncbi:MAG TPA: ABC transporter substrate-binding protein [Terriglobales bacterium]|nr:ABC transporter substrate-binding protein [Terriglobales bacterium]
MNRTIRGCLGLALGSILLFAGCKGGGRTESGNTIRIGVITSLTGSNAAFGQAHKNGYTIALKEINDKGGILGKQVELDYYDDQSKPDQAVQGVSKVVDQDHVPVILGAYSSESTRAILPVVTQKNVPLIIPTAVADNVMETGSPWIFRICAGSGSFARSTLDFLQKNGAPKTLAIVYENTNFGQSNDKSMKSTVEKADWIKLLDEEAYQASSPDYKSLLQRVKAKQPDVIYFASYLLDASTLMRQAEQVSLNPKYYTSAGTGFAAAEFPTQDKGAGKYAEYTYSVSQWLPSAKWKGSAEFDQKYVQLVGSHPAYHGMEAYAALLTAAAAIDAAKSAQPQAIRDALKNLNLSDTPFGPVKFDAKGQNAHPVLVTQVQGGQYKVVWPPDAAETKPIIPTPEWSKR